MTLKYNLRALLLVLLSIGAIGGMVYTLYQQARADKAWQGFVQETITEVQDARKQVEDAKQLLLVAEKVGVDSSLTATFDEQIEMTSTSLHELGTIVQYVVEGELANEETAQSGLADLDIFSGLAVKSSQITSPERPYAVINEYSANSKSLQASLSELLDMSAEVDAAVEQHTQSLQTSLSMSREALVYTIVRGQLLETYAVDKAVPESDLKPLRDALDGGQDALAASRAMKGASAAKVSEALEQVDEAIEAINSAARALVDLLGIPMEDLIETLAPDVIWEEQDIWFPTVELDDPVGQDSSGTTTPPAGGGAAGGGTGGGGAGTGGGGGSGGGTTPTPPTDGENGGAGEQPEPPEEGPEEGAAEGGGEDAGLPGDETEVDQG